MCSGSGEQLLHLTAPKRSTRFCHHLGREHKSQMTMISIDLISGIAWQRCWDAECAMRLASGGYRKARALVGMVPDEVMQLV